jgi:hypothetical protein
MNNTTLPATITPQPEFTRERDRLSRSHDATEYQGRNQDNSDNDRERQRRPDVAPLAAKSREPPVVE